ncbi:MAG: ABC transporter ATP-binding protein, partial [Clostridia bacterium]|nr:ABC transporter ATP-binding protein [Clostridia bacterium]
MREYLPLLIVGAIIGVFTIIFIVAYVLMKNKKEAIGFDRNMPDGEIMKRLMKYATPYWKQFLVVLVLMLLSIAYDLIPPMIIGNIEELVKAQFDLHLLFQMVAAYIGVLLVSMLCTYAQAIILQKTGQKILSALRQD